jgi:pyruvate/2-oxoglutarate dehydrogenase complex dihydrolipoamide acyltransferase (E2) component
LVTRTEAAKLADLPERINTGDRPRVSLTDFIVRASALALRAPPVLNSTIQGDRIIPQADISVGVAVALECGLIVPVIRAADARTVREVSARLRDLADRARRGHRAPPPREPVSHARPLHIDGVPAAAFLGRVRALLESCWPLLA